MVRVEGLEPPRLSALDPKSSVSTNFTTPARSERNAKVGIRIFRQNLQAMNFTGICKKILMTLLQGLLLLAFGELHAQKNQGFQKVQIIQADLQLRDQSQPDIQRLLGNVVLGFNEARLYCDSAWKYDSGEFKALGNVRLQDGQQELLASQLSLNPKEQRALAETVDEFPVRMTAQAGELTAPLLVYFLNSKTVVFPKGGELLKEERRVEFGSGRYIVPASVLKLGSDVKVVTASHQLDSDSVHWYDSKQSFAFMGPSHLRSTDGRFELICEVGEFDERSESGWFGGKNHPGAQVRNDALWLKADSLYLPSDSLEPSTASGNVFVRDSLEKWELYGAYMERTIVDGVDDEEQHVWLVGDSIRQAIWIDFSERDSTIIQADSMQLASNKTIVWPNALFQRGDVSASCDTLIWDEDLDLIELKDEPKMWFDGWLLQSDTLRWMLEDHVPKFLMGSGHSGLMMPLDSGCFQQISGREIEGEFLEGELHTLYVNGNAESVYFNTEEDNPCREYNRSLSSRMRIDLADSEVQRISLLERPEGTWKSEEENPPILAGLRWTSAPTLKVPDRK